LFDGDVADFYDMETKDINQVVRNNPEKFPKGYVVILSVEEKRKWLRL